MVNFWCISTIFGICACSVTVLPPQLPEPLLELIGAGRQADVYLAPGTIIFPSSGDSKDEHPETVEGPRLVAVKLYRSRQWNPTTDHRWIFDAKRREVADHQRRRPVAARRIPGTRRQGRHHPRGRDPASGGRRRGRVVGPGSGGRGRAGVSAVGPVLGRALRSGEGSVRPLLVGVRPRQGRVR